MAKSFKMVFTLRRTAVFFGSVTVHQITDTADIDIDRAGANAASATHTLNACIVLVHIIFQLVHEALAYPVQFGTPGIMPAAVHGKQREHAAVPVAHPHARFPLVFILDIKAPAGGAYKGAGSTVYAGKRNILPEGCFVQFDCVDIL